MTMGANDWCRGLTVQQRWAEHARRNRAALAAIQAAALDARRDRQLHMDLDALTPDEDPQECETCDGDNEIWHEACGGNGCRSCDGTGFVDCPECAGGSVDDGQ